MRNKLRASWAAYWLPGQFLADEEQCNGYTSVLRLHHLIS